MASKTWRNYDLFSRYQAGEGIRTLAQYFNISQGRVYQILYQQSAACQEPIRKAWEFRSEKTNPQGNNRNGQASRLVGSGV